MGGATVDVDTRPDGTLVIQTRGILAADDAARLRRTVVHAVRRTRPPRVVVELHDLVDLDAINLGILATVCQLGDDHRVAVFYDHCSRAIADHLIAAGVPRDRLRHVKAAAAAPAGTLN